MKIFFQSASIFVLNLWNNKEMREGFKTYKKKKLIKNSRNQTFEHLLSVRCLSL